MLYKNTFSTEHLQTIASEFLQKDIDKCNEYQTNESAKRFTYREKRKSSNIGKLTQMPVTIIEGLAATDKG